MYKLNLVKLIFKGLLGMVAGTVLFLIVMPETDFSTALAFGVLFVGVPCGWQLINEIIGRGFFVSNVPMMLVLLAIKIFVSFIVGLVAYPILLVYNIVKIFQEVRA